MSKGSPDAPVFDLTCNRLTIRAESESDFLNGFEEHFWALMHSEQPRVTLDLARSQGMADDAFRMIALNMFEIGTKGKEMTIRIPEVLERFFKHANLYRVATIQVVQLLGKEESKEGDAAHGGTGSSARRTPLPGRIEVPSAAKAEMPAEERRGTGRLVDRRTGQVLDLVQNPTKIGRIPGNDILIAMPLVSKRHARIQIDDGQYIVEDLGSSNGTYVNGERVAEPTRLLDGARLQIAITSQYPNGAKEYTFRQEES